jgi:large subunit ribosomal protein L9
MEVILLERVAKLGQIGDVVRVRDGFARNFLLPHGKALRATKDNRTKFEAMKVQLEARNLELKGEAEVVSKRLDGQTVVLLRQAGEGGQLYGSVSTRDIAGALTQSGFTVDRGQIVLNTPIKSIGLIKVPVQLHPEVVLSVTVNVARSADEAERQARGEDLTKTRTDEEEERAEAGAKAEKFFERRPKRDAEAAPEGEVAAEEDAAKPGKKKREKTARADAPGAPADEKPAKKRDKKSGEAKGEAKDKT